MLEKRVYIWACFRTRTGTSSRTMLSLTEQNRTGHPSASNFAHMLRQSRCMRQQHLQLQLHQLQHYRASERARARERERGRCERWPCYILSDRLRDSEMCVWASVSAAAVAAAAVVAAEA